MESSNSTSATEMSILSAIITVFQGMNPSQAERQKIVKRQLQVIVDTSYVWPNKRQFWLYFDHVANQLRRQHMGQDQPRYKQHAMNSPFEISMPALMRNVSIDDFLVVKKLEEGGFGKVVLAIERASQFVVALKIIQKKKLRDANLVKRLIYQIKIGTYLSHPSLVPIYGFFSDQQQVYLIMQPMKHSLYSAKKRHGFRPFSQSLTGDIVYDICGGLAFLHQKGVIHRDIKPDNILVSYGGNFKIGDFGFAVTVSANRNTDCGTRLYKAPQIGDRRKYGTPVDIWGLGVIIYELFQCEKPLSEEYDRFRQFVKEIHKGYRYSSTGLNKLLYSAVKIDPRERPSAADILCFECLRGRGQIPIPATIRDGFRSVLEH